MIAAQTIRDQVKALGLSQVRAAAVIGINERTMRKYVSLGAPQRVFDALERYRLDPAALAKRLRAINKPQHAA